MKGHYFTMSCKKKLSACTLISYICIVILTLGKTVSTIKIRPQACSNAMGDTGTCMFVWQCIKQNGIQVGTCVDRFLVGACCSLPAEEDNLVPGASGGDPASPTKVKPSPTPNTTTTAAATLPPSVMTSPPLTLGTFRPTVVTASFVTDRPIASSVMGQSVLGQPISGQTPAPPGASSEVDYSECGVSKPQPKGKVVGGTHSAFGEWPWQASVRRSSFFGFNSAHRCGGAILSESWIATAAHCVDDLLVGQIRVRVGEYDFSKSDEPFPHQERAVDKKAVHPRYNFFSYENDLALLRLETPLDLQPHVRPICLPADSAAESGLVGVTATVTGWGRLSEGGSLPNLLQQVQVPIISNAKCQQMFRAAGRQESIPEIFLCAGYENGGRDSCQGDSGGPLQAKDENGRWYLAGIISWGIGCAEPNMPGVCTRISKFKDWILETIR